MTSREVCRLSCKILGLYTLTGFFFSLNLPINMLQISIMNRSSSLLWILSLLLPVLLLLLSSFLWFGAGALSARMISGTESSESASGVTSEVIQRIAFAFAGILILAGVIAPFGNLIQEIFHPVPDPRMLTDEWRLAIHAFEVAIRIALGVWLLFGAESLGRLLQIAKPMVKKDW